MDGTPSTPVEQATPAPAARPIARIGLVGAAAAALVAVGILAFGATATPAGILAADTGAGATITGDILGLDGRGPGFGDGRGFGGPGGISITAISGSSISLETADGWTRTIVVDSGTTFTENGDEISLSDLAVGDEIRFQQTLEDDGTYSIDALVVIPPHAGGVVTAVSGSTITVERRDGAESTITVTSGTTYEVDGDDATLADIEVGMVVMAVGTEDADGDLTATEVRAADPGSFPGPGGRHHGPGGFFGPNGGPNVTDDTGTDDTSAG
ncbi:MAG TPA: DUF5666 domain-containing protein [Candidatus Limnocylindrales bacterium]|nr:DUF5666 domain-containing protein [Candidatus Limnocylindrales bacterium]